MQLEQDAQQIQIKHIVICLIIFGARMRILFILKVRILMPIKWSYRS